MSEATFNLEEIEIIDSVSYSANNIIVRVENTTEAGASVPKAVAQEAVTPRPINDVAVMDVHEYVESAKNPNTRNAEKMVLRLYDEVMVALNEQRKAGEKEFLPLTETSEEDLPNNMAKMFMAARKKDGKVYNGSSLGQFFVALARHLRQRTSGYNVDIKSDPRYDIVRRVLSTRQTASAQEGVTPGMNSSDSVPLEILGRMHQDGQLGKGSPRALARTVAFILSTQFGCRCKEEIRGIQNVDLCHGPPSSEDPLVPEFIQLSERVTKTRRGKNNDSRALAGKAFADHQNPDTCPVRVLLFFAAKKTIHQNRPDGPLMLTISQKAEKAPGDHPWWFVDGAMGKNMIGDLVPQGVKETGLDTGPLKITARSSRKTMAQAAAESVCSPEFTSKVMGHRSLDSKLSYMKVRDPAHKATSLAIGRTIAGKADNMFSDIYHQTKKKVEDKPCTVTSGEDHDDQRERSVNLHYNHNQTLQYNPTPQPYFPPPQPAQVTHPPYFPPQYCPWPPQYYQAPPQPWYPPPPQYHFPQPHFVIPSYHPQQGNPPPQGRQPLGDLSNKQGNSLQLDYQGGQRCYDAKEY